MTTQKKVLRILDQKVVDQKVYNGVGGAKSLCGTWMDEKVLYEDGTIETVRVVLHDG